MTNRIAKFLGISKEQADKIHSVIESVEQSILNKEKISFITYEEKVHALGIYSDRIKNRYLAEGFLKECAKNEKYVMVYKELYSGQAKHDPIINNL